MDLSRLNSKQKEAVMHIDGPCLVLAGAGSGKTSVLTNRVAYLIENGIDPINILAITFTNKAAKEMKERITKLIGAMAYDIQISTFHSFGLRILKENYELLGYSKNFVIIDSDDSLTIIKRLLKELNMDPKYYNPREIKNKISSAKNEIMSVDEYSKHEFDRKIVEVYRLYQEKLKSNNSIDFDDLLILPIKLFRENPQVLKYYQNRYRYILIDEYQDTNEAQYVLSKQLSYSSRNIFVVGDVDQSIYSFRGANYKNILNFEKDYPETKTILLEENYRSTQNILNAANSVIKYNKERKDKNLWSNKEVGSKIKYIKVNNEKEEASFVAKKIASLVKNNNTSYEDICVLYRTNAQSRTIEEAMLKENIPYKIVGSFYFYNRKEIKDLLCYLRLIYNEKDDASFLRVINSPKRGIGDKTIENISLVANEKGISLYEAISSGKELEFKNIIEDMKKLSESLSLTELVDMVIEKSGMKDEFNDKSMEGEIRLENLEEFKSITRNYEEEKGSANLEDFLDELSLVSDISEHKEETNVVTLMTVHAVKGLEFDNVFVIGMEEGIFPHFNAIFDSSPSAIEEERRLCYVAITRAKKNLYLLSAKKRMLYGKDQMNMPSRFLEEIDPKYLEVEEKEKISPFKRPFVKKDMFKSEEESSYNIGDLVKHTEYGEGVVVGVDKTIITVAFSYPFGTKKLMKNHKNISKL